MKANHKPLTIGLIDDDEIYKFTAKKIIEMVDPTQNIIAFENGRDAMDFLSDKFLSKDQLPDILLVDIEMPKMNGWEFLDAYDSVQGELKKSISVYMVSSSIDEQDKRRSKTYKSVRDYIPKPLNKEIVKNILNANSIGHS